MPQFSLSRSKVFLPFLSDIISYNTTCPTARATKIRQFKDCFSCFYINRDSNPSQKLNGVAINHLKFVLLEIFPTWNITFNISSNTFVIDGSIVI